MYKFKGLLFVAFLLISFKGMGQIQIGATDMPRADSNYIYSTSSDLIDETETGAAHTWDYSALTPQSQDTFHYLRVPLTTFFNFAGTGTSCTKQPTQGGDLYSFFKTTSSQYQHPGIGMQFQQIPLPLQVKYNTPEIVYVLPLKPGTSKPDSSSYSGTGSLLGQLTVFVEGKRYNFIDGYGTLKTPYKPNGVSCIRVKSIVLENWLVIAGPDSIPLPMSRVEYKWLAKGEGIPLLEVDVALDSTGNKTIQYKDKWRNVPNPYLTADFEIKPDTFAFINSTLTFNNTTQSIAPLPITYKWTVKPNSNITFKNGTLDTSANPQINFSAGGVYSVTLTANQQFVGSSSMTRTLLIIDNSGIKVTGSYSNQVLLYPNPASGSLYFDASGLPDRVSFIEITDLTGRTVNKSGDIGENRETIDVSNYSKGFYLLKYRTLNGIQTLRFEVR